MSKLKDKIKGTSGTVLFEEDVEEFQKKRLLNALKKRIKIKVIKK